MSTGIVIGMVPKETPDTNTLLSNFTPLVIPSPIIRELFKFTLTFSFFFLLLFLDLDVPICKPSQRLKYNVPIGYSIGVTCEMSSDPSKNVTFKWFKGTDMMMRRYKNKSNKLSGITRSDSINENDGTASAAIKKKVTGMPEKSSSSKSSSNEIEDESNEGELIEKEEELNEQEKHSKLVFSSQESMSTLLLNPSSLDDFTTYYCYAKNSIGWSNDPCTFNLIQSGNS